MKRYMINYEGKPVEHEEGAFIKYEDYKKNIKSFSTPGMLVCPNCGSDSLYGPINNPFSGGIIFCGNEKCETEFEL